MATLKEIIDAKAAALGLNVGRVEFDTVKPKESIGYGMSLGDWLTNLQPAGMSRQQTNWEGGDRHSVTCIGRNRAEAATLLSHFAKIAASFTGDTEYNRIYPDMDNIAWDTFREGGKPRNAYWRTATFNVLMSINNQDIYEN